MQTVKGALKTAQRVGDTGLWAGKWASRMITSSFTGICPVCNNLQPQGHEDTLGRTPNSISHRARGVQPRVDIVTVPALTISEIKTKKLLEVREINKGTGEPLRDCRYCRLLCEIFDAFFVDEWMSWVTDTKNGMHLDVTLMIKEGAPLVVQCTGNFIYDPLTMHPRVDLELYWEDTQFASVIGAPTMGTTLPRVMDTLDPSCMQFAKECIMKCQRGHPSCARQPTDFAPTRLLSLGDGPDRIRLCTSLPDSEGWAALSHCWGTNAKPPMLKTSNIKKMMEGISLVDLPPTFSNAVQVCKELSVKYLWIDSLCILQDDGPDWEREAAHMGEVYQHANIVIIGASSSGPEVPFLGPREEEWRAKRFDFETPAGARVPIMARKRQIPAAPIDQGHFEPPFTDHWATWKQMGPLYKRGWCFQEAYLASRALHFAPGSLIYECKTHRRSQESPPPYALIYPGSLGDISDMVKWHMVVKLYTARQLTFGSDKLPAVSGIAAIMPQARRSQYLAGLWVESLLVDLLWHVMPTSNRSRTQLAYPRDRNEAPTWSWASINHGVLWNDYAKFQPLARIYDAQCLTSKAAPFGTVGGGHIKLSGRLKRCLIKHNSRNGQHHAYYIKKDGTRSKEKWFLGDGKLVPNTGGKPICNRYEEKMDDFNDDFDGAHAAFLCLGSTSGWTFDHVGLIVTWSQSQPDCMERVGSINRLSADWYDEGEDVTVTLI